MRIAIIDKGKCNPNKCQHECLKFCPINRTGADCVIIENKARIDEKLCTGCGICIKKCPFKAIDIINLPQSLDEEPIHQFGENGFRLFNLPTPVFGSVVGIIGKNGIGKSTAINILSGLIKPNFGKLDKEYSIKELIEKFKGTELHNYFNKLDKGEIKISLKPQNIEFIPKKVKGKVKELLEKVDEKKEMDKIIDLLNLKEILDRDISVLSGGELQRVAIAATMLKKANLYIFDEPTSFLDIKQRLIVSKAIRNLLNENTAVIVIEHDLIILDYLSDYINILYGKESAYGIVSLLKNSKEGINSFLEGYLREENIRIRDKPLKFTTIAHKDIETPVIVKWSNVEKKIGDFLLKTKEGEIHKSKVIGILGENGIGKTSFVKILAKVEEKDKGEIIGEDKLKISYKPQYLIKNDRLVVDVLREAIKKYRNELILPLNLEDLYNRKISELSGGELQRVAIAETLAREADLFLLDEPSAYLDIEQRLIIARIIKELMIKEDKTALIVEHDLLFIDYLSEELIVFEGKPAIEGIAIGPMTMEKGMNNFLSSLGITFRRDRETNRPRANKEDSVLDKEQKNKGKYYYL